MTDAAAIPTAFTDFERLAHARRSNVRIDTSRPVDPAIVDRLLGMAAAAPNHKRTFPWRFAVVTDEGRAGLGEALAADLTEWGDDEAKIAKARSKYLRAPVMVVVASRPGTGATMTAENRDATCAAIQNVLLGATALGMASLWSTGPAVISERVKQFCGFDADDTTVGLVYLGWPLGEPEGGDRPEPDVALITSAD